MSTKYKTIKWVLKQNIKNKANSLWTWDREEKNFTQIYQNYNDKLPIYTATQLLELIDQEIKETPSPS
jgi:hypothetical protein